VAVLRAPASRGVRQNPWPDMLGAKKAAVAGRLCEPVYA